MNLDFFNRLANKVEENKEIKNLLNELGNFLKNISNTALLEGMGQKENVSLVSKNRIDRQKENILKDYASKTKEEGILYFVTKKVDQEGRYHVEKYDGTNQVEVINVNLSKQIEIGSVIRQKNGEFILDEETTKKAREEIEKSTNQILKEQNEELEDYRREGHLYLITEDTNGRIYLSDQTESRGYEIEEVSLPKELREIVFEGTLLKYENGKYSVYE